MRARAAPSCDETFKLKRAQCHMEFESRNALHKHLSVEKHHVVDDDTPELLASDSEDADAATSSQISADCNHVKFVRR